MKLQEEPQQQQGSSTNSMPSRIKRSKWRPPATRFRQQRLKLSLVLITQLIIAHQTISQCSADGTQSHQTAAYSDAAGGGNDSELDRVLVAYPHPRNVELVRQIRAAKLDHQLFYPERAAHPGERPSRTAATRFFVSTVRWPAKSAPSPPSARASKARAAQKDNQVMAHYNRTNVVIKAFNYKFRLDLELNNNLFGPGLIQKHFLSKGVQQISTQKLEHCYYHARTQPETRPAAIGAFRTCNGLSGIIHVNNESFVIHPFYDADLSSKHPHIIYRYQQTSLVPEQAGSAGSANLRTNQQQQQQPSADDMARRRECGNSRLHEWALRQYNNNGSKLLTSLLATTTKSADSSGARSLDRRQVMAGADSRSASGRELDEDGSRISKRDVSLTVKYIELALVLSQDMFEKRNASSASPANRLGVLHDAIQIINCLDLYFSSANTRVALIYIETWAFGDQIDITHDVKQTLYNFLEYSTRKLYKVSMDAAHLLTGGHLRQFDYNEIGMSIPDSVCTSRAVSVSQEASVFEPFLAASTMAHMLGHNLGMAHDEQHAESQPQPSRQPLASSSSSDTQPLPAQAEQPPALPGRVRPSLVLSPVKQHQQHHHQVVHSSDDEHEEHEDEIKSRSVDNDGASDDDNDQTYGQTLASGGYGMLSSEPCLVNCLMRDHFIHLRAPVSFGNLVRSKQPANQSSSSMLTTLSVSQDIGSNGSLDPDLDDPAEQSSQQELGAADELLHSSNGEHQQLISTSLPFRFSRQSLDTYSKLLRLGQAICLFNKPNQLEDFKTCGNGIVDRGEDCDCGSFQECATSDSCCDPITCRFKADAECIDGACCDRCRLRQRGHVCRRARSECDLAESCDGKSGQCQPDVHKQNGHPCANNTGYCYLGQCPSHDAQCAELWGSEARRSDRLCYSSFNLNGTIRGNCGPLGGGDTSASQRSGSLGSAAAAPSQSRHSSAYRRCELEHMMCGTLQCQLGDMKPVTASSSQESAAASGATAEFSKKVVHSLDGQHHECKVVISANGGGGGQMSSSISYVRDGSKCANNKVCLNQTCQPLELAYRDAYELCPSDERGHRCSANGVCSTANRCHCDPGWQGHDCSQRASATKLEPPPSQTQAAISLVVLDPLNKSLAPLPPPTGATQQTEPTGSQAPVAATIAATSTAEPTTPPPTETPVIIVSTAPPASGQSAQPTSLDPPKPHVFKDSARPLVFILVSIVAAVFVGFALMANCYRRKGLLKPDKVLRHHQMNCKLDAMRSSFIARRLADAAGGAVTGVSLLGDDDGLQVSSGGPALVDLMQVAPYGGPSLSCHQLQTTTTAADCLQQPPLPPMPPSSSLQPSQAYGMAQSQSYVQTTGTAGRKQPMSGANQQRFGGSGATAATVHYFGGRQQPPSASYHESSGGQERAGGAMDTFVAYELGAEMTGDHVPLLMNSSLDHQQEARRPPAMRSFGAKTATGGHHHPHQHHSHQHQQQTTKNVYKHQAEQSKWTTSFNRARDHVQVRVAKLNSASTSGSSALPINRTASLGNVSRQPRQRHWQQQQYHDAIGSCRLRECCSRETLDRRGDCVDGDADDTADSLVAHRVLATPTRTVCSRSGRSRSCWGRRHQYDTRGGNFCEASAELQQLELDSCSAPSSPEPRDSCWSDTIEHQQHFSNNTIKSNVISNHHPQGHRSLSRQSSAAATRNQPNGYHEDLILGAISLSANSQMRQLTTSTGSAMGSHKRSQQAPLQQDGETPPLPAPPPPPAHLLDANEILVDSDEQPSSDHYASHLCPAPSNARQPTGTLSSDLNQWSNVKTIRRVPLNTGDSTTPDEAARPPATKTAKQEELSLIAQLQQLAHVQSVHQKQVSSRRADNLTVGDSEPPANDLHEFFSLPLSIQLSALLARSLRNDHQMPAQISTPIDDYLNNLNNTSVAASSRRSFKRPGGKQAEQQPPPTTSQKQQATPSGGSTGRNRQQVKLQNLQELINRLQKLHSQTMLQQQRLNEFDDEEYDDDEDNDNAATQQQRQMSDGKDRAIRSQQSMPQGTATSRASVDDMFVQVGGDSGQRVGNKWSTEGSSQSLGRAAKSRKYSAGSALATQTCADSMVNDIYSMSDSEDGAYVARMLMNQERQVKKKKSAGSQRQINVQANLDNDEALKLNCSGMREQRVQTAQANHDAPENGQVPDEQAEMGASASASPASSCVTAATAAQQSGSSP